MKNKKIISLICALSMVFSMFSAFSVFADDDLGIALDSSLSDDGTEITIEATATGATLLDNFTIVLNLPDGVTLDNITYKSEKDLTVNVADDLLYVIFLDSTGSGYTFTDNLLVTLTITLDSALSSDYVATLQGESGIQDTTTGTSVYVEDGDMVASSTTVSKWVDPNKTTVSTDERPEQAEEDDTETAVSPEGMGIALSSSIDETNTVVTIVATANEVTLLDNFTIVLDLPDGVTSDNIAYTSEKDLTVNVADGLLYVIFLDSTGNGYTFTDNVLVTLEITLPSELTEALTFTLQGESGIQDTTTGTSVYVEDGDMTASSTIVTPYEEEQDSVAEFDFDDVVGSDGVSAIEDADETSEVGLVITFYDEDGNEYDAVYGTDFVLKDSDGNILTEAQYTNVIGGYDADTLADLISGGTLVIYNDEIASVVTKVVAWGDAEDGEAPILATNTTTVSEDDDSSTTNTKTPKIKLSASPSKVYVGDKVTVTATITNSKDDGVINLYIKDDDVDSLDCVTSSGLVVSSSNTSAKGTASFKAALKGTVTVYATYTYTDADGVEQTTDESDIDIKIYTESSSGSSGSSSSGSSSGTGTVASGNYSNNATINYTTSFSDLDDVAWAQTAIYGLAAKNVIAGYEDGTFRPNNNITRAEFAKLLVLTFGFTSFTGASANFSDVPSTHWAYDYVAIAYTLGAITGYDENTFGPDDNITREQMATMIYRLVTKYNVTLSLTNSAITFDDDALISDYAREAVSTLQQAGVINGMGDGTFAPQDSATRAQAAVMLYKFVN